MIFDCELFSGLILALTEMIFYPSQTILLRNICCINIAHTGNNNFCCELTCKDWRIVFFSDRSRQIKKLREVKN
jgi:hypothetical protein